MAEETDDLPRPLSAKDMQSQNASTTYSCPKGLGVGGEIAEEECLDLSTMSSLEDDMDWLFSTPNKRSPNLARSSVEQLSRKMLASFESPELLPRRRALTHKLHDFCGDTSVSEKSVDALRVSLAKSRLEIPNSPANLSSHDSSFSISHSNGGSQLGNSTQDSATLDLHSTGLAAESEEAELVNSPASSNSLSVLNPTSTSSYCTRTFTRPKKGKFSNHNQSSAVTLSDANGTAAAAATHSKTNNDEPLQFTNDEITSSESLSCHSNDSNYSDSLRGSVGTAGKGSPADSSTFVRRRNQTRTIDSSTVLEAQRMLSESPSSLEQSDLDSLGALPDTTFRRREPTGNTEDKSKRESLDIQTLAKLQEQSLRDSLSAVRKASTSPAGSVGVPSLNISDLDSSTGSLSSSNEESFSQRAEEKANQGSGTFRVRKPTRNKTPSPTLQLNGDTPIIHKSVVNTKNMSAVVSSPGTNSPHIRTSLSPRSVHAAKPASSQTMSGLRNPKSSLPAPTNHRTRSAGTTPKSGLRPPTSVRHTGTR